jgi:hypothetical protein
MKVPNYERFFAVATVGNTPFGYQCRLACGDRDNRSEEQRLASGTLAASRLITIPTGCRKTAAVMLAWLWNRVLPPQGSNRNSWPRCVLYCLHMQTPSFSTPPFSFETRPIIQAHEPQTGPRNSSICRRWLCRCVSLPPPSPTRRRKRRQGFPTDIRRSGVRSGKAPRARARRLSDLRFVG